MIPFILGLAGWLSAGPLAATLLVGRTGAIPSLRWLAVAAGTYALLLGTGACGSRVRSGVAGVASAIAGVRRALPSLALLAAMAPLLPVLYRDDSAFHLTRTGSPAPYPALAAGIVVLAAAGTAARWLANMRGVAAAERPRDVPDVADAKTGGLTLAGAAATAGIGGVALMVLLNQGLWEPLARPPGQVVLGRALVALNLLSLAVAAAWMVPGSRSGPGAGLALLAAGIVFRPFSASLTTSPVGPLVLLVAGAVALARRRQVPVMVALVTVTLAACGGMVGVLGTPTARLGPSAIASNASAAGAIARLFSGPGALTASAGPAPAPAIALWLGAVIVALLLLLDAARHSSQRGVPLWPLLPGVLATLLLIAPNTPPEATALAIIVLSSIAYGPPWRHLRGSQRVALGAIGMCGFMLAGTAPDMLLKSATEVVNTWPAAASLPAVGLALLALAPLLALRWSPSAR